MMANYSGSGEEGRRGRTCTWWMLVAGEAWRWVTPLAQPSPPSEHLCTANCCCHGRIHIGSTGCGRTQTNTQNMLYNTGSHPSRTIILCPAQPERWSPQLPNNGPTGSQTSATTPPHGTIGRRFDSRRHASPPLPQSRVYSLPLTLSGAKSGGR